MIMMLTNANSMICILGASNADITISLMSQNYVSYAILYVSLALAEAIACASNVTGAITRIAMMA